MQYIRHYLEVFFVALTELLEDRGSRAPIFVESEMTPDDSIHSFDLRTEQALTDAVNEGVTITLNELLPFSTSILIALLEQAVRIYTSLVDVNACRQFGLYAVNKAGPEGTELNGRFHKLP